MIHRCEEPKENGWGRYGGAISFCESDAEGRFWVDNLEYRSQVSYCPFCGEKAGNLELAGEVDVQGL